MSSSAEVSTRQVVRERSGGTCEIFIPAVCRGRAENISHRKARSQGGLWTPANCMDACGSGTTGCHGWVESHWEQAHKMGLRLSRSQDPECEPVLMRTAEWPWGWYRLLDDGTIECRS